MHPKSKLKKEYVTVAFIDNAANVHLYTIEPELATTNEPDEAGQSYEKLFVVLTGQALRWYDTANQANYDIC